MPKLTLKQTIRGLSELKHFIKVSNNSEMLANAEKIEVCNV